MGDGRGIRSVRFALALLCSVAPVAAAACSSDRPSASARPGRAPVASRVPPPAETPPATSPSTTSPATTSPPAGDPPPRPTGTLPAGLDAVVVSVTDGDTIRVRITSGAGVSGTVESVRLTGIDTPETRDPRTVVECFGSEASAQARALLPAGTAVRLETDVEVRDRYRRLLAYVWRVADALFVNAALVEGGWAVPYRYPPNVRYADEFTRLGVQARLAGKGLWSACGGPDTPASGTGPSGAGAAPPGGGDGTCDSNYAGACIPVSATDLDCGDVGVRRFQVVGTDVHGFDGDRDGIACE